MNNFFANLYEWFGFMPLYSSDMKDHLKGWDITCTDFIGTPWYVYIGSLMIITTGFVYALQYHIMDSPRFCEKKHWWLFALILTSFNFLMAMILTYHSIHSGNHCYQLRLGLSDSIGFGISNALWSLLLLMLISSFPLFRRWSTNCSYTTFWKP